MKIRNYIVIISSFFLLCAGVLQAQHMHVPYSSEVKKHSDSEMHHARSHECDGHHNHSENEHNQEQHACDVCQVIAASNALIADEAVFLELAQRRFYAADMHVPYVKTGALRVYSGRGPPMHA